MQPSPHNGPPARRSDEDELYRRYHDTLQRSVARAVRASPELIEDACQMAWMTLLRTQPKRTAIFAWLRRVAIHESYRLSTLERRTTYFDHTTDEAIVALGLITDPDALDSTCEALEALRTLAALPERQRRDLTLHVAGYTYNEIARLTGGRTYTNVDKTIGKARARIRLDRLRQLRPEPGRTANDDQATGANSTRRPS
jgi:RNA polymerase sigma factor (sigma-70 family)